MKKFLTRCLSLVICLVFLGTSTISAMSARQKQIFDGGTLYLDDECAVTSSSSDEEDDAQKASSIYVLGDSLTVGMRDAGGLQEKLEEKGWNVSEIEATNGDTIELALPKVEADKDKIESSGTIVVSLGTNQDTNFPAKIDRLVQKIEQHNSSADIKWINVADLGGEPATTINRTIQNKSRQHGFEVLDWSAEINARSSRYPTVDGLHQTTVGYRNRSQWTANQIGEAPEATTGGGGGGDSADSGGGGGGGGGGDSADAGGEELSLRDKLAKMLMPRVDNQSDLDTVTEKKVGGLFIGRDHISGLSSAIEEKQGSTKPFIVSIDGEGGTVDVPISSNPPSAREMGNMSDEEVKNIAKEFGQELGDLGVTMDLAPVADVVDNVNGGVIRTRSFGGTNQKVIAKAGAFADGLREAGLLPTFKHFPGHGHATETVGGSTLADTHLDANAFTLNKAQLANNDMAPFVELASSGASAIMVGHLIIPDVDSDRPATVSKPVVTDLLRGELGYDGLVITDDMGDMAPITSRFSNFPEAVVQAVKAGNDMILFVGKNNQIDAVLDRLENAVESGAISEDRIDESIARIDAAREAGQTEDALEGCECSATGSGGAGDFTGSNNVEIAYNFFTSLGLSPEAASGIIGNLMAESGVNLDPNALNSTNHFGIAQWGGRQESLAAFARALGKPKNDFETQLKFIWHELTGESEAPNAPNAGAYRSSTYDPLMAITESGDRAVIEAAEIFRINYEVVEAAAQKRQDYALQVYRLYGGGSGSGGSGGGDCSGSSTVDGAICPDNIESRRHPTMEGYYQMPDAPNGEYTFDPGAGPDQRYGSKQLVCVIYTVALAYKAEYGDRSTVDIGDLNASGHKSHNKGIAVDLSADGSIAAANNHSGYNKDATITLGKMFVDTGSIQNIWWCPTTSGDNSEEAIRSYAEEKGTPIDIHCISGHENHFHVDIKDEFALEFWEP